MARSRWELEEKKKKKALEAVKQAAQAGTAYRAPKTAQEAAKAATGTVISRPAQKSATSSRSAAAAAPAKAAPTAQKQSGFRSLAKLPETVKRTAAPTVAAAQQRASDRSRLQENMLAWHGADTAGRRALEQENAAIRGRLGLAYNARTGVTYDPQTGKNYSLPTQLAFGQDAGRRARTASQYPTSREFAGQGADSVSLRPNMQELAAGVGEEAKGVNAHRVLADLFRRSGEAWTERDRENRDAAVLALQDEMARILSRYGLRYSRSGLGASDMWALPDTVSDRNAAERLRQAGADADEIAYIEENIALREGTHRIRQGAEAAGKGFAGGIASLGENIAQNYENWQENQQNPEYRAAQDELRQIETRIGLTPRQNADGTMNSEYAALEQRAEELRAKMLLVSDTGRVDPDAWGQRMLREAGQAQENATAGLAPVPRFLAGQGISIAQNLPAMGAAAIPVVGPAAAATMMGAGAAGQRAYELNQRADVSPGEALQRGLVSGAVEAATEKFPLDAWAELLTRGGTGMVKNLLRQMGIEATEEGASYVLNYAADRASGDPKAAFSFQELAENAIGGAVSGLFFGTAGTLAGRARRSTSVDTNPATHTPEQMAKINEYVDAVDEGLLEFVQQTAAGETTGTYQLENVSDRAAHDIHAITGIDATGFQTKIEPRMIRHIIARHGANGNADHSMADANNIARIQYVLNNYDQMLDGGYSNAYKEPNPNMPGRNRNARTVVYVKKINGSYYVVEAVPVSRQKTAFITSTYMQKGDQPILNAPNNAPGSTSENASLNLLNNNIAQNGVDGNGMGANNGSADQLLSIRLQLPEAMDDNAPADHSIASESGNGNSVQADAHMPERGVEELLNGFTEPLTQTLIKIDEQLRIAENLLAGPARENRIQALQEGAADVSRKLSQIERNKAEYNAARTIAERFGARMELRDLGPAGGMYQNGVIIINPYTDSPVRQVLVHELTHHLESSGQYAKLQRVALDLFASEQNSDIDTLRRNITALYARNGVALDTAAADRELTAAFCESRLFTDEASIQRLARTDATLFQRIRQWIADAVARLRGTAEQRLLLGLQRMYEKAARTVGQVETDGGAKYLFSRERDENARMRAEQMERGGASRADIWQEVGLVRDTRGNWVREIDDSAMRYDAYGFQGLREDPRFRRLEELTDKSVSGQTLTAAEDAEMEALANEFDEAVWSDHYLLRDYVKHDELFSRYPSLKNVALVFEDMQPGQMGYFDTRDGSIHISNELKSWPQSTLLHEIQHIIQRRDRRPGGANPGYWEMRKDELAEQSETRTPMELYRNTAGEIEAREAAGRQGMTASERRAALPDLGWDRAVFAEDAGQNMDIKVDAEGDPFVDVTADILDGKTEKDIPKILSDIIENKFHNLIIANGQKIGVNAKTGREWRRSKEAQGLWSRDRAAYDDKIRAFDAADKLLTASRNYIGEAAKHRHYAEFARGKVNFRVGENGYAADVIVGITKSGRAYLYDLVNIKHKKIADALYTSSGKSPADRSNAPAIDNSIRRNGESVNPIVNIEHKKIAGAPLHTVDGGRNLRTVDGASTTESSVAQSEQGVNTFGQNTFGLTPREIAEAAVQFGRTPEQAVNEARVKAQAEAAQEAARSEREEAVSTLIQAWNDKRAAEKQAEQTREALTLTEHDIRLAQNAALSGVDTVNWEYADDPEKAMLYGKTLRAVREADQPIRQYFAQRAAALQSEAQKAADALAAYATDKRTGAQYQRETMERNIRDIFGKEHQAEAEAIIREYITPVHKAVAEGNRLKNELRGRVKALKLNRHERALVQMRLEAEDGAAAEYIKNNKIKVTPEMDAKINRAAEEFRNIYNELYSRINETLLLNGQEPVLFRMNYAPHFTKDKPDTLLGKIRFAVGLGKDSNLNIPTDIAGQTETFRPGKKWFGNLLQRKDEITDYDAVAGFDQYIEGAVDVITLTESIQKLRALEDQVRYTLSDEGVQAKIDAIRNNTEMDALQQRQAIEEVYDNNRTTAQQLIDELRNQQRTGMGRFVTELRRYTDNLAGKKSREDRGWEDMVNRQFYTVAKNMEGRVAANMISLNPGSWLTNFIPITQASGEVSVPNLVRGMYQTVKGAVTDDGYKNASTFLTNRYGSESIDKTLTRRVSDLSGAPMELIDHFTANTIHRARYAQNIDSGMSMEAAMDDADAFTASLMADRSKGALPTAFNATNPVRKVFTMFQVEVNNQLSYLFKDMPKAQREKGVAAVAWAYTKVFTGAYFFNLLYSQLTGRDSALDPIGMLADALGVGDDDEDERTAMERLGGLAEDIGGQIPFIGGVLFDGGRVPVSSAIPNFANLGKAAFPGAFGVEWSGEKRAQTAMKELGKPLTYLVPPFGGGAVRRAIEGFATVDAGGSYTYDNKGNRTLQFPAYGQKPQDYAKTMLFGKWSSEEAQEYIENGFKGLSADETAAFDQLRGSMGVDARQAMDAILSLRGYETVKDEEGNTLQTVKEQQRLALFDNENLTAEQKAAVDRILIVSGEDELPADYTDRNAFLLGQYVSESRRDAAREGIEHGLDIDQFVQWDDRLRKLTGEEDESGDRVRSAAEARGMVLDEVMQDGTLKDSEKQAVADYVLISSMGDEEDKTRKDWEEIARGKVNASDFLRFKTDVSGYEEAYKNTGADNAVNVAAILRGYEGLDDGERDVLFQTYSRTMINNPFHVSEYEQRMQDNGFFGELNAAGKAAVRSLANEYEQAVREGKDLEGSWMGKAYMAKEAGISPETYILFRTALKMNDYDGNGSYKNTEIEYAVKMLPSLTDSQRAYLWQSANGKDSTKNNPWGYAKVTKYQSGVPEAINPVANGTQTSAFGPREAPTAGASTEHMGLDIGAAEGEPVKAILSGKVVSTGYDSGGGYFVQIDHGDGRMSTYMHMKAGSTDGIHVGDEIGQGQQIGAVGSTGVSTGPHLDIRITQDGKYIDPLMVIPGYGIAPSGYVDDGSHGAGVMASGRAQAAAEEAAKGSGSSGLKPLPTFKGLKKLGF